MRRKPARQPMVREVNISDARNLSPLVDEVVRQEHPVKIVRNGKDTSVLVAQEAQRRLLSSFRFRVDITPRQEGGFTLWLRELDVTVEGATAREARQKLVDAVRSYVEHYFAEFDYYRHLPDKLVQEPYINRLSLAENDDDLLEMLFGKRPAPKESAASAPEVA